MEPPPFGQQQQPAPWGMAPGQGYSGGYDGGYGQPQQPQGMQQAPQGFQQPAPNFGPPAPGFQQPPQQGLQQPMPPGYGAQAQMGMGGPPSTGGMMGGMQGPGMMGGMQGPGMMGGAQGPGMAGGMSGPPSSTGGGAAPMGMGGMGGGGADIFTGYLASGAMQSAMGTFQRGQAWLGSGIDKLSGSSMHHVFAVTPDYVRKKLLLLLTPFLGKWDFARHPEQVSGGQRFLAPRQDVNAPDLYIPFVSLCTYCLFISFIRVSQGSFKPENLYNTAWYAGATWGLQVLLLKAVLYMLGIASFVPWLELAAYSGYMFFPLCLAIGARSLGGSVLFYVIWAYASICVAVFLVRTMKRIILHEVRQYNVDRTLHNYLLLGVAAAQFPVSLWLSHV